MDKQFAKQLMVLYPGFLTAYGPYRNKETGRQIVILKGERRSSRTISWPRAMMEVKIGRRMVGDETADHVDDDPSNDDIGNIQILPMLDNIRKSAKPIEMGDFVCPNCFVPFQKDMRTVRHNQRHQGKLGPFCGRSCATTFQFRGRSEQV